MPATIRATPRLSLPSGAFPARSFSTSTKSLTPRVDLPHMLPSRGEIRLAYEERAAVGDGTRVIVYDNHRALLSRRRVCGGRSGSWATKTSRCWTEAFPLGNAAGYPIETGPPQTCACERHFTARMRADLVRKPRTTSGASSMAAAQNADPRRALNRPLHVVKRPNRAPGLRGGHMPGARSSLPFGDAHRRQRLFKISPNADLQADLR